MLVTLGINRMLCFMGFRIPHLHISHNAPYLAQAALIPRRNEKQRLCKILGSKINKVHYGTLTSGILPLTTVQDRY